ncbi:2-phosphosulfolactate phosphatase [Rouxiella sp. WC2420]|uniref:Probable 2-phosphosulfolactate phosphatase n=1 Tax=Rouxiella sp. WC2420 TaxID=3234145 RepID=A0AB39VJL9_9GAMM
MSYFSQTAYDIRLEWGLAAVENLAADVACVVIIDVMSFSSCVSIAADRGALLFPYPWKDSSAIEYAREKQAEAANFDRRFSGKGFSLSPHSLLKLEAGKRLVLPSPNGSAITFKAKAGNASIFCASLRNLQATAQACQAFSNILLVPCGEKWADGTLRPALEDLYAAGGLAAQLQALSAEKALSPEAQAAAAVYRGTPANQLRECASAQELIERGFAADVELCLENDVSPLACQLIDDAFTGISSGKTRLISGP